MRWRSRAAPVPPSMDCSICRRRTRSARCPAASGGCDSATVKTTNPSTLCALRGALISAPLNAQSVEGLVVFTVALSQPPDAAGQRALRVLLRQIEQSIDGGTGAARDRQRIAEKLLEPAFQRY